MLISKMLARVVSQFKEAGIKSPVLDAELLLSHSLSIDRYRLNIDKDRELASDEIKKIKRLASRRLRFEPIAYIVGKKEFYSLEFIVNRNVLIPRPETELLVDLVIYYAKQDANVLDLGTGSGAIAVSVKYNRSDLNVFGIDISESALKVAKKNARNILGKNIIKFYHGNLFEPLEKMKFQVIASNPPYVDKKIAGALQKELRCEPEIALFSDNRGIGITEEVISESSKYLVSNGVIIIEIGSDMKDFVKRVGKSNGFSVSVLNDYSGLPRVAVMKK